MSTEKPIVLDIEVYPNYFLILLKRNEKSISFEIINDEQIGSFEQVLHIIENNETLGFNSRSYDVPIILYAKLHKTNRLLYELSKQIIKGTDSYKLFCDNKLWCPPKYKHIDIVNVVGNYGITNKFISLKMYASRIGYPKIQELPFDPDKPLSSSQIDQIRAYCHNDIDITNTLYENIIRKIDLRRNFVPKFGFIALSKSDSQIATLHFKDKSKSIKTYNYKYVPPSYLTFCDTNLNNLLKTIRSQSHTINKGDKLPKLPSKVDLFGFKYKFGVGGLHSIHEKIKVTKTRILSLDVSSYYPSLIINNDYFPKNLSENAKLAFKEIYEKRLIAKNKGETTLSDCYKIILNGTFGNLNNPYSNLYSPVDFLNITITGQLLLLSLIERLHNPNITNTISANTDGIFVVTKDKMSNIVNILSNWQNETNLKLDIKLIDSIYFRDVNNYVYTKDNKPYSKGAYLPRHSLNKNSDLIMANNYISKYIINNSYSVSDFLKSVKDDIEDSLELKLSACVCRKATSGTLFGSEPIGKIVRWYYTGTNIPITNAKGHIVASSTGGYPVNDIGTFDVSKIDWNIYEQKIKDKLSDLIADEEYELC